MRNTPFNYGEVAYYRQITSNKADSMSLIRFLNAIKRQQFHRQIMEIRKETNKRKRNKLKNRLPAICPAASFSGSHNIHNITSISGFISIDIDNCSNLNAIRDKLYDDNYLFSMFVSPSGNGLKVIFKADYDIPTFLNTFLAIEKYFNEKYCTQIDIKCKNINRLMFVSSDANLLIRKNSCIFKHKHVKENLNYMPKTPILAQNNQNLTETIISKIEALRIDITAEYSDWLKIAFALVAEFGIDGLHYFHRISRFYPNYDAAECETQYNKCFKSGSRCITIKSLYSIAKDYGITFNS
jgi:hypothetical protein